MNSLRKTISLIGLKIKTFGAQFKFEKASGQLLKFNTRYPNGSFIRLAEIITKPKTNNKNTTLTENILNQTLALNDFHRLVQQRSLIETQRQAQKIKLNLIAKAKKDLNAGKTPKLNKVQTNTIEKYFKSRVLATYKQYGVKTMPSSPTKHQASHTHKTALKIA